MFFQPGLGPGLPRTLGSSRLAGPRLLLPGPVTLRGLDKTQTNTQKRKRGCTQYENMDRRVTQTKETNRLLGRDEIIECGREVNLFS